MVRAPCCENKAGMKKGPWSADEDRILTAFIHKYGHGNWRALPKHAGLMRCGKSCRLRWVNYLRPDIKRGNFTQEEQETIIRLHQAFGNRWSAIAAKLPGRTDNEIKNVWNTHLKKLVSPKTSSSGETKKKTKKKTMEDGSSSSSSSDSTVNSNTNSSSLTAVLSPEQSHSNGSHSCDVVKEERFSSLDGIPGTDESFNWLDDALLLTDEYSAASVDFAALEIPASPISQLFNLCSSADSDDMDFWFKVFMEQPQI
ncbi:hypothetical protein Cni_G13000 [Canna indica]|uniref:Uncharacterized protein n=1 Tax=Canna indica TaxID=4628 RepID=A0AAQ3KAJ3_9LILI|nr:hypothetical protein Cni_G13000 [Canna indica]